MIRISRLAAIVVLLSHSANAGTLEDDILEGLHKSGYQTVGKNDIERIGGAGSNTDSIHLIRLEQENGKEKRLVCKELKGIKQERQNLESLGLFVEEYEDYKRTQPYAFPPQDVSIAKYKAAFKENNREFVLFEEASGQSVFSLMVEWAIKGYDSCYSMGSSECKYRLSSHFENVGHTIANFHLKYGIFDEKTCKFTTITLGDLHTSNVFYNLFSNETTFIDYETMAKKSDHSIFGDAYRLFTFAKDETIPHVKEKAGAEFCSKRHIIVLNDQAQMEKDTYVNERLAVLDDFFHAIKMSYIQTFLNAGYVCNSDTWQVQRVYNY